MRTLLRKGSYLHSLFELISRPSDWPCISSFDFVSFPLQQLLPVFLGPAELADPGSWRASKHREREREREGEREKEREHLLGWGSSIRRTYIHLKRLLLYHQLAGIKTKHQQDNQLLSTKGKTHKKNTGSIHSPPWIHCLSLFPARRSELYESPAKCPTRCTIITRLAGGPSL